MRNLPPAAPAKSSLKRRWLLAGATSLPLVTVLRWPADAAQFSLKFADGQLPDHPVNTRAAAAVKQIREATHGAVAIRLFPNSELGADPDLITQLRDGGVDLINMGNDVLTTLVPAVAILNLGYAFTRYAQVWQAVDGGLGDSLRAQIAAKGLLWIGRSWDNGFRQVTSATKPITDVASLSGFKIRVPSAPMLTSLFQGLNASPTPINFNELYSALQTRLVDGEENALPIITTAKLYEVQKYLSITNHSWGAYMILANSARFERLPRNYQDAIIQAFDGEATGQRDDIARMSADQRKELAAKGMVVNDTDPASFRAKLVSAGYYSNWKSKFGDKSWSLLEQAVGPIG
jgi:TRAP-type transport system periplasmic protein